MKHAFFAVISRMKYIPRWSLMRNTRTENLSEHTQEVAVLAHGLALLTNRRFGGQVDVNRCVLLALYHDTAEIFTGDLPTPVKYFSTALREAYRQVEDESVQRLVNMLPQELQADYEPLLMSQGTEEELRIVKAADKLSALIKCIEELRQGNREFEKARKSTEKAIKAMKLPAAEAFLAECLPSYELTIDEQG